MLRPSRVSTINGSRKSAKTPEMLMPFRKHEEGNGRGDWTRTKDFLPHLPSGIKILGVDDWANRLLAEVAV